MSDTYQVVYSPRARAHLARLRHHVAGEASPTIAARFTDAIQEKCETLETFPHRGTLRRDLGRNLRSIAFRRSVTVIYRVRAQQVEILAIVSRGRDLRTALRD